MKAITKYVRITPNKARHIARLIQGKKAVDALGTISLVPRKSARLMEKTLRSAIANAENNFDLDRDSLVVKEASVGAAPTMKRFMPRAKGAAGKIMKRMSHFRVVLSNE